MILHSLEELNLGGTPGATPAGVIVRGAEKISVADKRLDKQSGAGGSNHEFRDADSAPLASAATAIFFDLR
jgi:hypothetical protein